LFSVVRITNQTNQIKMLGIEKLKEVLVALIRIGNKVDSVTQDGFQLLTDGAALLPNVTDLIVVLKNGKEAVAQLKDLDPLEREDLLLELQDELDLADDKLEVVIEKGFVAINAVVDFGGAVKDALKK
jgi:hypothetical protein